MASFNSLGHNIHENVMAFLDNIWIVWKDVGLSGDQLEIKKRNILATISEMMDNILKDEMKKKDDLIETFNVTLQRVNKLVTELEIPSFVLSESSNILVALDELRRDEKALERRKLSRNKEYEDLKLMEKNLCDLLREGKMEFSDEEIHPIPKIVSLDKYRSHILVLEELKKTRKDEAKKLTDSIKEITSALEIPIEDQILSSALTNLETFILSEKNLNLLRQLEVECKEDYKKMSAQMDDLKLYIKGTWTRLGLPYQELDVFLNGKNVISKSNLDILKNKVKELDEMKTVNIDSYMEKLRDELNGLTESCWLGQDQKTKLFGPLLQSETTDSMEEMIVITKSAYKDRRVILETIKTITDTQLELAQLEKKSLDPRRLNNRGACLLQYEKERNRMSRLITKLNRDLKQALFDYEGRKKTKFLVFDQDVTDYIAGKKHV